MQWEASEALGIGCPEAVGSPRWESPAAAWPWLWASCSVCPAGEEVGLRDTEGPTTEKPPPAKLIHLPSGGGIGLHHLTRQVLILCLLR